MQVTRTPGNFSRSVDRRLVIIMPTVDISFTSVVGSSGRAAPSSTLLTISDFETQSKQGRRLPKEPPAAAPYLL